MIQANLWPRAGQRSGDKESNRQDEVTRSEVRGSQAGQSDAEAGQEQGIARQEALNQEQEYQAHRSTAGTLEMLWQGEAPPIRALWFLLVHLHHLILCLETLWKVSLGPALCQLPGGTTT